MSRRTVCGQSRRNQFLYELLSRDENFAAHVPALLGRCQLIFEVNGGSATVNQLNDDYLPTVSNIVRSAALKLSAQLGSRASR
jgi:hypothetical protein